jgi:hypothetical protein
LLALLGIVPPGGGLLLLTVAKLLLDGNVPLKDVDFSGVPSIKSQPRYFNQNHVTNQLKNHWVVFLLLQMNCGRNAHWSHQLTMI